eukprot:scpid90802/ scgid24757/ MFS-type transporter SLC18B1; Solute carrier family 18 member B1
MSSRLASVSESGTDTNECGDGADAATSLLKSNDGERTVQKEAASVSDANIVDSVSSPTASMSPLRRGLIVLGLCLTVASSCIQGTFGPFYFRDALEKNPGAGPGYHTAVGAVFSVTGATSLVVAPVVTRVLRDVGSKQLLVIASATRSAASLLFSTLNSIGDWRVFLTYSYILRFIQGFGLLAITIPTMTYLTRMYPHNLGFVNSWLIISMSMGKAAGLVLSGGLYDVGGFKLPFLVTGATGLLVSLCVALFIVDIDKLAMEQKQRQQQQQKQQESNNGSTGTAAVPEKHVSTLRILCVPWVWVICLFAVSSAPAYSSLEALLAPHVKSQFGASAVVIGAALALFLTQSLIFGPILGGLLDRGFSRYALLALALLLIGLGCLIVAPATFLHLPNSLVLVFVSMFVSGVGRVLGIVTFPVVLAEHLRDIGFGNVVEMRVAVSGLTRVVLSLGSSAGPLVMSPLVAVLGFQTAFTIL